MHCAASVQEIDSRSLGGGKSSTFSVGGHNAHDIAAKCIVNEEDAWTMVGQTIEEDGIVSVANAKDATAVQDYLNAVRGLPYWKEAARFVEVSFHCPEIHRAFYGQSDLALVTLDLIDIWDYKHGVGISVDVERNTQLMMYAVGVIRQLQKTGQRIPKRVRLTICQPRAFHQDGPIRSWETTTDALEAWIKDEWLPAAARTESNDPEFAAGNWCQFCPAKLDCPELKIRRTRVLKIKPEQVKIMEDYELSGLNADIKVLGYLKKAAADETYARLMNGKPIAGSKLVKKKADRVWKEGAEAHLKATYGAEAYDSKLKSPAAVEDLPQGKPIVRQYAYKPEVGMTVADVSDVRTGQKARTAAEVFGLTPEKK